MVGLTRAPQIDGRIAGKGGQGTRQPPQQPEAEDHYPKRYCCPYCLEPSRHIPIHGKGLGVHCWFRPVKRTVSTLPMGFGGRQGALKDSGLCCQTAEMKALRLHVQVQAQVSGFKA